MRYKEDPQGTAPPLHSNHGPPYLLTTLRQKKRQSKEVMTQRGRLKKSEEDEEKKEQRKVTNTATVFTSERLLAFLQCPLFDMTGSER